MSADAKQVVALSQIVEAGSIPSRRPDGSRSALEIALLSFLESKAAGSTVPVEKKLFLTMAESGEFSGLPVVFLRRLIASGKLKALKTGAGWRVSRADIEKISGTLTDMSGGLTEHELRDMELNRRRRQQT